MFTQPDSGDPASMMANRPAAATPPALATSLRRIREQLVENLLLAYACLAFPLVVISCYRAMYVGWHPVMALHPCALLLLWAAYLRRRTISTPLLAYGLIGLSLLLGVVDFWNFGLLGVGVLFFVIAILLSTLLFGLRAGFAILLGGLLAMSGIGLAVVRHLLHFSFNPATAVNAPSTWLGLILSIGCLMGAVVVTVGRQYAALLAVLTASARRTEQLQQAEEALTSKQAFLDEVVELLPRPLAILDPAENIIFANQALRLEMERRHVLARTQILLLDPHSARPVPDESRPVVRALRGEQVADEEYLLAVSSQAGATPCLISATPICEQGVISAVIILIEDITALKEAEQAKDEFLAVLTHELQTPLTSMLGWSDLALDKNDHAFYRQAMAVVHRNAERQKGLVSDILDMSRLLHRKAVFTPVPTDLRLQVEQALENIQQEAADKQLIIQHDPPVEPFPVQVDIARFQQCLANLLHNCMKFTPVGGKITVAGRRHGEDAHLTIRDTGCGIAQEMLPLIFLPFRQVDRNEQTGGLGLGLAITRGIVEQLGGRIWAESAGEGLGCAFTIVLPLSESADV